MLTMILGSVLVSSAPQSVELTVYNQGFGFVKEVREFALKRGRQSIAVEDVAAMIEPDSVGIRSLDAADAFLVLEQNYQYDLISPLAILAKSVGQRIRLVRTIGNQRDVVEGTLISSPIAVVAQGGGAPQMTYNGLVLRTDDGRIVLDPTGEVEVLTLPPGLISKPTLLWDLEAQNAGSASVELTYITRGMRWEASYVLSLDEAGKGDLRGWVTLDNQSGATFENAQLKLIAGEVQRAQPDIPIPEMPFAVPGRAAIQEAFQQESLFEYHLYTLTRPATVRNRETKQVSLLEAAAIPVQRKLIVDSMRRFVGRFSPNEGEVGTGDISPQVRIEFVNDAKSNLGMPLPKGKMKVFLRDRSGSAQFIGEDTIDHTPKGERISLVVGRSFDVVSTRKRTNFERLGANMVRETFEIEVRNRKDVPESVHVIERMFGDWKLQQNSMPFEKLDSHTIEFKVALAANESKTVRYTVETRS